MKFYSGDMFLPYSTKEASKINVRGKGDWIFLSKGS